MMTPTGKVPRFVRPEVDQLPISGGDTITVKRRLNNGERRAMFARMHESIAGELRVNTLQTGVALVVAYLVDWTLVNETGEMVAIRHFTGDELAAVLDSLDPDSFTEIKDAIQDHVARQEVAAEQEKRSGWRERIVSDLAICRAMHWRLEDVLALPVEVYDVLVEELNKVED